MPAAVAPLILALRPPAPMVGLSFRDPGPNYHGWRALLGLSGCGLGGPAHGPASGNAAATVDMGFTSFQPETVHIRAGQTVEWRNTAIVTHSVTDDARLASRPGDVSLPAGATPFRSG